jgi:poly-gamma-glutamate synthesis protein (capsule biosynthesis protein)
MWSRRAFLAASGAATLAAGRGGQDPPRDGLVTFFMAGDVMTGRGIDQALPHPSKPRIHEGFMTSALGYLELAERASGPIPRPVGFSYVWGDVLADLERRSPDLRIVNLETSATTSDAPWPGKGIHYRMHPDNAPCLRAASLDVCVLANNHVLDWGRQGLLDTLEALRGTGIAGAGAGRDADEAERPAVIEVGGGARVLVFGLGSSTAGIPRDWAAGPGRPGVRLLPDLGARTAAGVAEQIGRWRRPGDLVVASIHWGGNWGYAVAREERDFAHRLVDEAGVDLVHGHSSHHPKGIEVHGGRLVLHGCGDFLNDYEGIAGYEEFRSHLVLAYFATLDAGSGRLVRLEMTPYRTRRFRLERAAREEAEWLGRTLDRESRGFSGRVALSADGALVHLQSSLLERNTP